MKTGTVKSAELGDDWSAPHHLGGEQPVRLYTRADNLRAGDVARVRAHVVNEDGTRPWHQVTVLEADHDAGRQTMLLTDAWPVAYVCARDELVEVLQATRTATACCRRCRTKTKTEVALDDFVDVQVARRLGLSAVEINLYVGDIDGLCAECVGTLLD